MKVKLTIPTQLKDIKLSQYQKFIKTTKDSDDENFIARQIVAIFCNITDEVVDMIKAKDYESIVKQITEVLNDKPQHVLKFKMDGVKYGFIPKLEDITVGEKADLDNYLQDVKDMDKAMAVLYRPILSEVNGRYLIEPYKGDGDSLDITLDVAFGASVFFSNLMKDLLNCTQNFIEDQVAHNHKVSQILEENGVGIATFMPSLKEMFSDLKKFL